MSKGTKIDALDAELKDFVAEHIHGWDHQDWHRLMGRLGADGYDVSDTAALGLRLERAHILATLERLDLRGVGPKRRERLADHYPSLWQLRQASVDELAAVPTINRVVAETVRDGLARRTGGF